MDQKKRAANKQTFMEGGGAAWIFESAWNFLTGGKNCTDLLT